MKAIEYDDYGGPAVLHLCERAKPQPRSGQVLIRVHAASINPIDWRIRRGEMRYLLPGGFPRVPGFDVSGTIETAPPSSDLQPGDRVLAFLDNVFGGGYAEYACCSSHVVARIPDSLSFEDAAAIPLAASTALQSLLKHGHLEHGQHVVITGASGGVGTFAVQIAKVLGAEVTGVASGKNRDLVMSLGADHFIDYQNESLNSAIHRPCHLFFDAAGKTKLADVEGVLKSTGRFISTEPDAKGIAMSLWTALKPGQRYRVMLARGSREDLQKLVRMYSDGYLKVIRGETFDLAQAAEAHRYGEDSRGTGKIVLRVAHP